MTPLLTRSIAMPFPPARLAIDIAIAAQTPDLAIFVADAAPAFDVFVRVLWQSSGGRGAGTAVSRRSLMWVDLMALKVDHSLDVIVCFFLILLSFSLTRRSVSIVWIRFGGDLISDLCDSDLLTPTSIEALGSDARVTEEGLSAFSRARSSPRTSLEGYISK
ncbi:hypothetical protein KC320_g170 [Hortaea werneckii]|nr:hypothetical protein KC320_g170 [Hortaea werneckii]